MPLIEHLRQGFEDSTQPPAWHRNEERRARGLHPVHNPATQLESWEREIVWTEILLLSGSPEASFRHLARGWGRDKGFHTVLAQFICERHGNVERKKRRKMNNGDGVPVEVETESTEMSSAGDPYDDTLYAGDDYNEALVANIFCFESKPPARGNNPRLFSFEDGVVSLEEDSGSETHDDCDYTPTPLNTTAVAGV